MWSAEVSAQVRRKPETLHLVFAQLVLGKTLEPLLEAGDEARYDSPEWLEVGEHARGPAAHSVDHVGRLTDLIILEELPGVVIKRGAAQERDRR